MARVEVKLISQGINVEGSAMEDGLVYPIIKGILYVKWRTYPGPNGVETYISDTLGHPDDGARIASIKEERGMDFTADDIPSDIKLVPFEEGGINPYDFLGLYKTNEVKLDQPGSPFKKETSQTEEANMKTYDARVFLGALLLFCVIACGFTLWYHHPNEETCNRRQGVPASGSKNETRRTPARLTSLPNLPITRRLLNPSRNPVIPPTSPRIPRSTSTRQSTSRTRMPNHPRQRAPRQKPPRRMFLCRLTVSGPYPPATRRMASSQYLAASIRNP